MFVFGATISDIEKEYLYRYENGVEEPIFRRESSFDIWLGIASLHVGWKGKEYNYE